MKLNYWKIKWFAPNHMTSGGGMHLNVGHLAPVSVPPTTMFSSPYLSSVLLNEGL